MRKRTQVLSRSKGRSSKGRSQIRGKPKATQSDTGLAERIVTLFKDGILVTDLELNIVEINKAFNRVRDIPEMKPWARRLVYSLR
ncbi:MAG: hypothetical protein ABW145_09965, partial [Candidatus Thiodiazotropha sp.]